MTSDPIVVAYWDEKKAFITREADDYFSVRQYEATFPEYVNGKRGLLGSSNAAIDNAFLLIATDHVALGLEHAKWAKRCAEAAIQVGDLGAYQNWPQEFGMYTAYKALHEADWLLQDGASKAHQMKSLEYLAYCRAHHDPARANETANNKELDLWGYVVPFLVGSQIEEATRQFDAICPGLTVQTDSVAKNSTSFPKVLRVLLDYLNDKRAAQQRAQETLERYYFNITGWGHGDSEPRARMWKELVRAQHVDFARLRAQYITHITDPITIVRSIRGVS